MDVLKVEVPVNMDFVEGAVHRRQKAYTRDRKRSSSSVKRRRCHHQALHLSVRRRQQRRVYRGAGTGRRSRRQVLRRALRPRHLEGRHSGLRQAGSRCLPQVAASQGVKNINNVNQCLKAATSWHSIYESELATVGA